MVSIKDISGLMRGYKGIEQKEKSQRIHDAKSKKGNVEKNTASIYPGKDKVVISSQGQALAASKMEVNKYAYELRNSKIASQETIENIRGKIESNFYSGQEVLDKVVESLIYTGEFKSVSTEKTIPENGITEEHLAHIRKNIKNGSYNSNDVLETVVSELVKII